MNIKNKIKILSVQKKAALAYIVANLLNKGLSYLTLPIFTRLMPTNQMGIVTTFSSWQNILYPIITLSLTSGSINVAFLEYKENRDKYESNILTISSITGFCFLIISLIFKNTLSDLLLLPESLIVLLAWIIILNPALDIWYARQRYEFQYIKVLVVSVISSFSSTCMAILFLYIYKNEKNLAVVRLISQNIPLLVIYAFFFLFIFIKGKSLFVKDIWIYALKLSLPLIVHALAKNILDLSDRLMIAQMCGNSKAGIYGTVYGISSMSLVIWSAINSSLIPDTFNKLEKKEYNELNSLLLEVMCIFGLFSLILTLFAPEILEILTTSQYYEAVYIMPAIAGGVYLTCVYNIFGNLLLFKKKSLNIMFATLSAAILNIVLNYVFIKTFGYMAAAYTTMASFILLSIFQGGMVKIIYKEHVANFFKIGVVSLFFVLLELLCIPLYRVTLIRYILVGSLIVILFTNRKKIFAIINNDNNVDFQ